MVCSKLDITFPSNDILDSIDNDFDISQIIIKSVKNKIGIKTIITIEDIAYRNPFLIKILLTDILNIKNNIQKINNREKKRLTSMIKPKSKDDKSIIAWTNSVISNRSMHCNNIDRDVSDGLIVLRLLDKCKKGCIPWKQVRKKNIRHKFDKLGNCKVAIDVCTEKFPFSLVGMGGNDIVE